MSLTHDSVLFGDFPHTSPPDKSPRRGNRWSLVWAGVSPEMAVRLSIAFDTTAESWLNQQMQFDLWLAEKRRKSLKVSRLAA